MIVVIISSFKIAGSFKLSNSVVGDIFYDYLDKQLQ